MLHLVGPGGAGKTTAGAALVYVGLAARKVETMRPVDAVVADLQALASE